MSTETLRLLAALEKPLAEPVRDALGSQLRFHFPAITSVRVGADRVEVEADASLDVDRARSAIDRIADTLGRIRMPVRPRVYDRSERRFDRRALRAAAEGLVADLREAAGGGWGRAVPVRTGLNVHRGEQAALFEPLDRFVRRCLQLAYQADELKVPAMVPAAVLGRAGYFETAYQHLAFVAPINHEPEAFAGFAPYWRSSTGKGQDAELFRYLKIPTEVLNPALCLHCYPLLDGRCVRRGELVAMTLAGSCFREESGNLNNAERLYEFRMREGVFVAGRDRYAEVHAELLDLLIRVGSLFGLEFAVETATDLFFTDNADKRVFSQLVSDNKLELRVASQRLGRTVACASLNKHQMHFTAAFDIRDPAGEPVSSLCLGFGIDRLIYLLGERFGDLRRFADHVAAGVDRWTGTEVDQ
jgi:seryl-tRNA synthetase